MPSFRRISVVGTAAVASAVMALTLSACNNDSGSSASSSSSDSSAGSSDHGTASSGSSAEQAPGGSSEANVPTTSANGQASDQSGGQLPPPIRVVRDCSGGVLIQPGVINYMCGDPADGLTDIHWSKWGQDVGVGVGQIRVNDCTPTCADGHISYKDVTINVSAPVDNRFTKITITNPDGAPYTGALP